MRRSLTIGDEITTIGGIVGRIVSIKDGADTFIIETGVDRSKIKIKRWAISSCNVAEKTQENVKQLDVELKPLEGSKPQEAKAKTEA